MGTVLLDSLVWVSQTEPSLLIRDTGVFVSKLILKKREKTKNAY